MCGIWMYLLNSITNTKPNYKKLYKAFMKTATRGPDRSIFEYLGSPNNAFIGFHRLSIMDTSIKGDQPFKLENGNKTIWSICNGEIYNYKELENKYNFNLKSGSDCEIISHLYKSKGIDILCKELIGEYAFIILELDLETGDGVLYASRDRFGIRPLFIAEDKNTINFSSEIKSIVDIKKASTSKNISVVEPREYLRITKINGIWGNKKYTKYYDLESNITKTDFIGLANLDYSSIKSLIRDTFIECVNIRLSSDRPLGCLLSGGLDSSLVASIAARELKKHGHKLRTFSIGLPGSTDEYYARLVAKHIDSIHTHIQFKQEDFIDAIKKVIYVTETYDITTVRASTGQYLVSKWIAENTDIKVLLIGDGSDELTAGYMYFHKAPTCKELHEENIRLLKDIHYFDVLRADRGIASNGLEARVPFLDHRIVDLYLSIDPELRHPKNYEKYPLEKWLLREAFNIDNYLPDEILFRKKEAFSDGVSSVEKSWYLMVQEYANTIYSSESDFNISINNYTHNKPHTKEALYFRHIWESFFGTSEATSFVIPYFWLPKWCGDVKEPSARVLEIY